MHPEVMWQRAILLVQQQRWTLAIQELRGLLSQAPDHAPAHALLAEALAQTDQLDEALAAAQQAIGIDPELDYGYGALASVLWHRRELEPAANAIRRAIELDPDDVHHHTILAQIRLGQRRWEEALAACDDGLELAPNDTDCLNLRSLALNKLGRGAEATDTLDASLAHDPDNPFTHQARGIALLHRGDPKGALHHFQEALRRDPNLAGARAGMLEALKARNPVYRVVLAWFLWLERFSGPRRLQIVLGLWLAARFGADGLDSAGWTTAGAIVRYSWLGFVLITACAVPIFNLLLLLHPVGRRALERRPRNDALLLGATLLVGLSVGGLRLADGPYWTDGWPFWLALLLPVAGIGLFEPGWGRRVLQLFCLAAVGVWLWWAIGFQAIVTAAAAIDAAGGPTHQQRIDALLAENRWHLQLLGNLVLAVALSTWFVLLAPKGEERRRIGADG